MQTREVAVKLSDDDKNVLVLASRRLLELLDEYKPGVYDYGTMNLARDLLKIAEGK